MSHATNSVTADDARKREEADFHDQREIDRVTLSPAAFARKYPNLGFYRIVRRSREHVRHWMAEHCPGAVALDYCCGLGENSLTMARAGATVHGIDISAQEIASAQHRARAAGLSDRTHFEVMDAEHTTFPDDTFDVIVCSGVLHHIDLDRAYPELARILKPTGAILCIEAMRHNPIIHWYRRRTPHLRTAWEVEHILGVPDIERAKEHFGAVRAEFYHLATIPAIWAPGVLFGPTLAAGEWLDRALLRIPGLRRMAWQAIFTLAQPNKQDHR